MKTVNKEEHFKLRVRGHLFGGISDRYSMFWGLFTKSVYLYEVFEIPCLISGVQKSSLQKMSFVAVGILQIPAS